MAKSMCKVDKKKKKKGNGKKAKYKCRSCGQKASKEKFLCKPLKI